ncbi:YbaB/EbfC family nucleoid-associated protein [Streptomyces sp. 3N207]|uniref:YbaB/EbfC family nucleoid-associated protein n=1 Tax=Streptomyces sp. 3N207 TaxID=3457417 RepID=UPI003FD34D93
MTEPTESMEERVAQARAHLEATRAAVARAEEDLRDTSETVRSGDRAVEVTIGPQGELAGLKFLDGKHANMTGPQLASSVLEAAERGRRQIAQRVRDTFEPLLQQNPSVPGSQGVDVDWDRIFGSALEGGGRAGGRSARNRLHDEIHEDADDASGGRS